MRVAARTTRRGAQPLTTADIRRQAKRRIERLSPERLPVADDFLANLEEREANEATEELPGIPGFVDVFEQARRDVAADKLTPVENLRRRA